MIKLSVIRTDEIAPEGKTRHLIVKTHGVVAHADRVLTDHGLMNLTGKFSLGKSVLGAILWEYARNGNTLRTGHRVHRRFAVKTNRLFNLIEMLIGTNGSKLSRAIQTLT